MSETTGNPWGALQIVFAQSQPSAPRIIIDPHNRQYCLLWFFGAVLIALRCENAILGSCFSGKGNMSCAATPQLCKSGPVEKNWVLECYIIYGRRGCFACTLKCEGWEE